MPKKIEFIFIKFKTLYGESSYTNPVPVHQLHLVLGVGMNLIVIHDQVYGELQN